MLLLGWPGCLHLLRWSHIQFRVAAALQMPSTMVKLRPLLQLILEPGVHFLQPLTGQVAMTQDCTECEAQYCALIKAVHAHLRTQSELAGVT